MRRGATCGDTHLRAISARLSHMDPVYMSRKVRKFLFFLLMYTGSWIGDAGGVRRSLHKEWRGRPSTPAAAAAAAPPPWAASNAVQYNFRRLLLVPSRGSCISYRIADLVLSSDSRGP